MAALLADPRVGRGGEPGALAGGTRITTASLGPEPGGRTTVTPEAVSISSALRCCEPPALTTTGPGDSGTAATGAGAGRASGSRRVIATSTRGSPPCGSPRARTSPLAASSPPAIAPAATFGRRRGATRRANRPRGRSGARTSGTPRGA